MRSTARRCLIASCPLSGRQYLKAGLVDEMEIHVANVLLAAGRPLFANIGDKPIKLERIRDIATSAVTQLRYRVVKQ